MKTHIQNVCTPIWLLLRSSLQKNFYKGPVSIWITVALPLNNTLRGHKTVWVVKRYGNGGKLLCEGFAEDCIKCLFAWTTWEYKNFALNSANLQMSTSSIDMSWLEKNDSCHPMKMTCSRSSSTFASIISHYYSTFLFMRCFILQRNYWWKWLLEMLLEFLFLRTTDLKKVRICAISIRTNLVVSLLPALNSFRRDRSYSHK